MLAPLFTLLACLYDAIFFYLAILTFDELRGLARWHSIDGLDSMARAEVVGKLREAGVGVLHSSAAGVVERLDEMMRIVASISDELAALRDYRGREIKAAEEKGSPLREFEAIVKRELASLSDRVGDLERAIGGKQHKHARPQMTAPLASYSKIERAQRDLHATSRGEGSVLEDIPRNEPKELYSQAISRDTAPIDLPMDISVDQAPFEGVMSRKEHQRFTRRLASEPSRTEEATSPAERQIGSRKAQTNPIRRHESSRYIRERTSDRNPTPSLDTVPRGPLKGLYLGQIPYGCQTQSIAECCRDRDVEMQCIIIILF